MRVLLSTFLFWICAFLPPQTGWAETLRVLDFQLDGPAADASMEFSGLAWWGDRLILLPQYPDRAGGAFVLERASLLDRLTGNLTEPLRPVPIPFEDGGLRTLIPGFEGYEAIVIDGDEVFALVEARHRKHMRGWLVGGGISKDGNRIIMNPGSRVRLDPPVQLRNMAFEALALYRGPDQDTGELIVLFEANGRNVHPNATGLRFTKDLRPRGTVPMAPLEYRLTDVTPPDANGHAWGLNIFWTGEAELLAPAAESPGTRPNTTRNLARLVPLRFSAKRIESAGSIVSLWQGIIPSNWEGIVPLDMAGAFLSDGRPLKGFLIVTDTYPVTRLGFVALPQRGLAGSPEEANEQEIVDY